MFLLEEFFKLSEQIEFTLRAFGRGNGQLGVVSNKFYFHPYLGKIPNFDEHFSKGLKPPTRYIGYDRVAF